MASTSEVSDNGLEEFHLSDAESLIAAKAETFNRDGDTKHSNNDFIGAIDAYSKGIELNCENEKVMATLYRNRANSNFHLGNYRDALNDIKAARQLQPTCLDTIERGVHVLMELQDYDQAITWCDDGLTITQLNQQLSNLKERCLNEQRRFQNELDEDEETTTRSYSTSRQVLQELRNELANARQAGNKVAEGIAYGNLGNAYGTLRLHKLSIEYYKLCSDVAKEIGNRAAECASYCDIGNVYYRLHDFNQAIEFHNLDLSISTERGDAKGRERAYCNLGNCYRALADFKQAIEYHKRSLEITQERGDKRGEGRACGNLGSAYYSIGDLEQAIVFHQQSLDISKQLGDRAEEARACGNLGNSYRAMGSFKEAVKYHKQNLLIAQETGDKRGEARAYGSLGNSCRILGKIKESIKYQEFSRDIAQEVGDRTQERNAYGNLGNAYQYLGDYEKAISYHKLSLEIDEELGNTVGKAGDYGNLGNAYESLGDSKQAIVYFKQRLKIYQDIGDTAGEGRAYGSLGTSYFSFGNYKEALKYHMFSLESLREVGDMAGMGRTLGNIGIVYNHLGDYKQAIEYHSQALKIAKELGARASEAQSHGSLGNTYVDLGNLEKGIEHVKLRLELFKRLGNKDGEGHAYGQLGTMYYNLGNLEKAMDFQKMCLNTAREVGNKAEESAAYTNVGLVFEMLGDVEKAIEYYEKSLHIANELGHKAKVATAYANLGCAYHHTGDYQRAMEYDEKRLDLVKEIGDKAGEGRAYYNKGLTLEALGSLDDALVCYKTSFREFNKLRSLLRSKDDWKISLRNEYQYVYTALWKLLLKMNKTGDALCAAEHGRAQALKDLMTSHYGVDAEHSLQKEFHVADLLKCGNSDVVFLAVHANRIYTLLLPGGKLEEKAHFKEVDFCKLTGDLTTDLQSYVNKLLQHMCDDARCEDRSLDGFYSAGVGEDSSPDLLPDSSSSVSRGESDGQTGSVLKFDEALRTLYDSTIAPIADLIGGKEVIIVPDGVFFMVPFAAFKDPSSTFLCESLRIRVLPSLTSLKLIEESPASYHYTKGALIVGDPCLDEIVRGRNKRKLFKPLPCAKQEAELIGNILKTSPLTGKKATKEQVLNRLNSVALVHIAAHGKMETGEIALAPNPDRASDIPKEDDFLLTMNDVLTTGLRAQLVVLSCCHSGRGDIKAEGVVGIARAFLGAGARSVLVSLWAISDEATLEFMKGFYEQLFHGKSASESLNLAMKSLRESEKFNAVNYWAPFVLIGDDVTLKFKDTVQESAKGDQ